MIRIRTRTIGLLALSLLVCGCGGSASGPMTFSQINTQVLQPSCAAFSSCHSPTGAAAAGQLDMTADPYTALVGVAAKNAKAASEGKLRVKPGDAANSFLFIKITLPMDTDPNTDYGARMPFNNPPLPQADIDGIKAWIDSGAPNN